MRKATHSLRKIPEVRRRFNGNGSRNRRLPEWLTRVRSGQLALPRFQRYESWSHGEAVTLLDSVLRGRPVEAALVLAIGDTEPFVSRRMAGAPAPTERTTESCSGEGK